MISTLSMILLKKKNAQIPSANPFLKYALICRYVLLHTLKITHQTNASFGMSTKAFFTSIKTNEAISTTLDRAATVPL